MAFGMQLDGLSFNELALVERPTHAAAIGRIVTSWSLIEGTIAILLGFMMHQDHRAALALLGSFRTNKARIDAVRKVGKEVFDASLFAEFDEVMKSALAYAEERNAIAHGVWGSDKDKPEIVYLMSMQSYAKFFIEGYHTPADETLTKLDAVKAACKIFTLDELEKIELRGQSVLERVMNETTQKGYSLVEEKQATAK